MKLPGPLGELTYCLNIHPAETWEEVRAALRGPVRAVKKAVAPNESFAVGLRLSARALQHLASPASREELKELLARENFRVLTVNGFPYGDFHRKGLKEAVYQPDWLHEARLEYTRALAELMAELGAPGQTISLSTVPGAFKPVEEGGEAVIAEQFLQAAAHCVALREATGVIVAIALEPEPGCLLETVAEAVGFFQQYLFSERAVRRLAALTGLSHIEAERALPRHLGLCYDVCHAAVEFEDPQASIARLRAAGIPVHKVQLSAALRVPVMDAASRVALTAFDEPTYLHQVVVSGRNGLARYNDLPEALAHAGRSDGDEWRIHYHVPVFSDTLARFKTTQAFLIEILALHRRQPISPHLEIETYTWHALPEALKTTSVEEAIARELRWVLEQLV